MRKVTSFLAGEPNASSATAAYGNLERKYFILCIEGFVNNLKTFVLFRQLKNDILFDKYSLYFRGK